MRLEHRGDGLCPATAEHGAIARHPVHRRFGRKCHDGLLDGLWTDVSTAIQCGPGRSGFVGECGQPGHGGGSRHDYRGAHWRSAELLSRDADAIASRWCTRQNCSNPENRSWGSTPAPGVAGCASRPASWPTALVEAFETILVCSRFSARARKTAREARALPISISVFGVIAQQRRDDAGYFTRARKRAQNRAATCSRNLQVALRDLRLVCFLRK